VDLYLVHWPMDFPRGEVTHPKVNNQYPQANPPIPLEDTWKAMEELVDQGLAKSIGVSNFNVPQLEKILSVARIKPVVNQYEYHPYLQQPELHRFCTHKNIVVRIILLCVLCIFYYDSLMVVVMMMMMMMVVVVMMISDGGNDHRNDDIG
jgi:aryl-alcohol dehydrogenase-like predicted oxidoreductase